MKQRRVLLITYPLSIEGQSIKQNLSLGKEVDLTVVSQAAIKGVTFQKPGYDLVLFDCEVLSRPQLTWLFRLSELADPAPIMILASEISVYAYQQVASMKNMVTLQKPFQTEVFTTIVAKMLEEETELPTRFPRFITDQPVRMIVMKTGLLIPTRMKNYSAGGAFLEYHGISLKIGDRLQVRLGPDSVNRPKDDFLMQARVVWIKDAENRRSPARGVGIQFLEAAPI